MNGKIGGDAERFIEVYSGSLGLHDALGEPHLQCRVETRNCQQELIAHLLQVCVSVVPVRGNPAQPFSAPRKTQQAQKTYITAQIHNRKMTDCDSVCTMHELCT